MSQRDHHAQNRTEGRRSARFTSLTTAIGEMSNDNLHDLVRLQNLGLPRSWVLAILRTRRHPSCFRPVIACFPNNKYRTIDGTCNNVFRPIWGSSYHTFRRLFPAQYSDGMQLQNILFFYYFSCITDWRLGISKPKGLPPQRPLPNARLISSTIHGDLIHPDSTLTNFVPQVGQFLDHDFALTIEDGERILLDYWQSCWDRKIKAIAQSDRRCCTTEKGHRDCFPIEIPKNDYFYSNLSTPQTCMDFTRSTSFCFPSMLSQKTFLFNIPFLLYLSSLAESGVREQFNIDTSYIDASQVYGSENKRSRHLREFSGGKSKIAKQNWCVSIVTYLNTLDFGGDKGD